MLNVALFFQSKLFWKKSEGTSAVNAVIYADTAQSLNGLARDLLTREPFTKAVILAFASQVKGLAIARLHSLIEWFLSFA